MNPIEERIKKSGINVAKAAIYCNVSEQTISNYIKGTRAITMSTSLLMDELFGLDEGTIILEQRAWVKNQIKESAK